MSAYEGNVANMQNLSLQEYKYRNINDTISSLRNYDTQWDKQRKQNGVQHDSGQQAVQVRDEKIRKDLAKQRMKDYQIIKSLFDYLLKMFTLPDNFEFDVKVKPGYLGAHVIPKQERHMGRKERVMIEYGALGLDLFIDYMRLRPKEKSEKMHLVKFYMTKYPRLDFINVNVPIVCSPFRLRQCYGKTDCAHTDRESKTITNYGVFCALLAEVLYIKDNRDRLKRTIPSGPFKGWTIEGKCSFPVFARPVCAIRLLNPCKT